MLMKCTKLINFPNILEVICTAYIVKVNYDVSRFNVNGYLLKRAMLDLDHEAMLEIPALQFLTFLRLTTAKYFC